jgi:hypothetical protein
MSRFALFAGDHYYPCGGMEDLVGRYESLEAAREAFASRLMSVTDFGQDWYQIVDLVSFEVVDRGYGD